MRFDEKPLSVRKIVDAWKSGSLLRNEEYQRGEVWTQQQQQGFIDSILRGYPVPALFFEEREDAGLDDKPTKKWEVIDGQQRIIALSDYLENHFDSLEPGDRKLRLPWSMRNLPVSWGGRRFNQLDSADRKRLEETALKVFMISGVKQRDQVRDLFIRLQSGTALTRQQIRDAWPGNLGPYVEQLAGRLRAHPTLDVFAYVDGRGIRDDEGDSKDPYVKHRTTCAQVLQILLARVSDPLHIPTVGANELDALYHEHTATDPGGDTLTHMRTILEHCEAVCKRLDRKQWGRRKFPKQGLFALAMFFQDALKNPSAKFDSKSFHSLAHYVTEKAPKPGGRSTSGRSIRAYYEEWRQGLPEGIGIVLDSQRTFSEQQKKRMFERDNGLCGLCRDALTLEEAEADHYPLPWRDGGPTTLENGRLVHTECHPRGRPALDEFNDD